MLIFSFLFVAGTVQMDLNNMVWPSFSSLSPVWLFATVYDGWSAVEGDGNLGTRIVVSDCGVHVFLAVNWLWLIIKIGCWRNNWNKYARYRGFVGEENDFQLHSVNNKPLLILRWRFVLSVVPFLFFLAFHQISYRELSIYKYSMSLIACHMLFYLSNRVLLSSLPRHRSQLNDTVDWSD